MNLKGTYLAKLERVCITGQSKMLIIASKSTSGLAIV